MGRKFGVVLLGAIATSPSEKRRGGRFRQLFPTSQHALLYQTNRPLSRIGLHEVESGEEGQRNESPAMRNLSSPVKHNQKGFLPSRIASWVRLVPLYNEAFVVSAFEGVVSLPSPLFDSSNRIFLIRYEQFAERVCSNVELHYPSFDR